MAVSPFPSEESNLLRDSGLFLIFLTRFSLLPLSLPCRPVASNRACPLSFRLRPSFLSFFLVLVSPSLTSHIISFLVIDRSFRILYSCRDCPLSLILSFSKPIHSPPPTLGESSRLSVFFSHQKAVPGWMPLIRSDDRTWPWIQQKSGHAHR